MQVCLDECHRVGTEASKLFPGSGAGGKATREGIMARAPARSVFGGIDEKVQVC